MKSVNDIVAQQWRRLGPRFLPFADVATVELPMSRLLRLSLFQITVGMAVALMIGTLNRVMIVELGVPAWLVALMVALPICVAPFRAVVGFRSDNHRCVLGWRRVPFIWLGTLLQFGGFSIMPFALLVLTDSDAPAVVGHGAAALAFLLVGAGLHTTQTVGLALATDLAPEHARPRVVAMMYVMLLLGMVGSAAIFGVLLSNFSAVRLIQVVQGAAAVTMTLNVIALWKQEARDPSRTALNLPKPAFKATWRAYLANGRARRLLTAVGLGTAAFNMQDILLEPYGGHVLGLSVGMTTALTALLAAGALAGVLLAARRLARGGDACRIAGFGVVIGMVAFASVILAAPLESTVAFAIGVALIGLGGGLFSVGTLTAAISLVQDGQSGLGLGAWGAVQASAAGGAIAVSGLISDGVSWAAGRNLLGEAITGSAAGYGAVYLIEIALLFATLIAIGPLVRKARDAQSNSSSRFGLAENLS